MIVLHSGSLSPAALAPVSATLKPRVPAVAGSRIATGLFLIRTASATKFLLAPLQAFGKAEGRFMGPEIWETQ